MRHVLSILVENEPGVLSRVSGLFSGRGFNIESLNVGPTLEKGVSVMTITTTGEDQIIEQIVKQLRKLGPQAHQRVITFLDERIQGGDDPRQFGKALRGDLGEFWRYRVGHYRIPCRIDDGELVVQVVRVDHRSDVD